MGSAPGSVPPWESTMGSTMVRYKVRPERADDNVALVEAVYAQLARERPAGIHYATFRHPDGVSSCTSSSTAISRADPG